MNHRHSSKVQNQSENADTSSDQQQTIQPMPTSAADHLAPLASLDCSITEPISKASQSVSSYNTPTLSGYFDCDQMSDMVDDSLFEITYLGCVSKSILSHEVSRADIGTLGKLKQLPESARQSSIETLKVDSEEPDLAPNDNENRRHSTIQTNLNLNPNPNLDLNANLLLKDLEPKEFRNGKMSSNKIDKSTSSSDICADSRLADTSSRSHLTAASCSDISDINRGKKNLSTMKKFTMNILSYFFPNSAEIGPKQMSSNHRGKPQSEADKNVPLYDSKLQQNAECKNTISESASTTTTSRHTQKARSKRKPESQESKRLNQLNLRDSIKVTNQRRQKRQAKSENSDSAHWHPTTTTRPTRSAKDSASRKSIKSSVNGSCLQSKNSQQNHWPNKATKCVKFSIPERASHDQLSEVTIRNSSHDPRFEAIGKQEVGAEQQHFVETENIHTHHESEQLKPIPIPISTSASACQTDSDKTLHELLAKYNKNSDLIAEINDKLKLNDAIRSPKSVLDLPPYQFEQESEQDQHHYDIGYDNNNNNTIRLA